MSAAADVFERVRAGGLLHPGRPVVVMLSGGRDSVALLDLAVRISGAVRALHVNYGLRDSADADEALCRHLCSRLEVPLSVRREKKGPGPSVAREKKGPGPSVAGNLQAWARDVRYAAARELAAGDDVAAGHTATDQVETLLYRLAASPGRRALLGMRERNRDLVRPLLTTSRDETGAYCDERGLAFADDPTNESLDYARNRIRHLLLPALREIHPAAEQNVLRTLDVLRDEAAVLDALLDEVRTDDLAELRRLPPALRRLLLGPRADDILALDSGALDLGGGRRAVVEHGRLRLTDAPPPDPPAATELPVPGRASFGDGELVAREGEGEITDGTLDAAAISPPLQVRAWEPGDRMRPLGLGGTKSLQDLFTDRKVPREARRRLPVVLSGDEIAWIPGVATGDPFRVTAATRKRVTLAWHPRPPAPTA